MGELNDTLAMTLGGRAAEEIQFGEITTGAANDLEKATDTAKQMIMRWGMSEKLGPRTLGHNQAMPFLGRDFSQEADYSEEIAQAIDDEIRRIIEEAHDRARAVLDEHREQLDSTAKILIERETLERGEFEALLAGTPEEEVFREKDAKARQRSTGDSPSERRTPTPQQPRLGQPAAGQSAQSRTDLSRAESHPAGHGQSKDRAGGRSCTSRASAKTPTRPGLRDTPRRVAEMWDDIFFGLEADPRELLVPMDEDHHHEMVLVRDIAFYSVCEHHLLPFVGTAHVAYIPSSSGHIAGLSKLARVVRTIAARPQLQERITSEVADTIVDALNPLGALVLIEAEHLCMSMRGVRAQGTKTVTSAVRGIVESNDATRAEVLALINAGR